MRAAVAPFDDDALSALANKGLVRRARKDIDTIKPAVVGPHGDLLRFEVEGFTVDLAAAPAQSKCSCPQTGVCRHILMAVMSLRASVPAPTTATAAATPAPQAGEEVLAVADEVLSKWSGKPLMRKATQALAAGFAAEFEEAGSLVVRFPTWNVVCRWMPGGGLGGMVCSCHQPGPCVHRVAAVLAYQAAKGKRQLDAEEATLEASAGAPRTREEVLGSVATVLREMVVLGLSRLSRASEERLRTLAVSAHGVDLPRLERVLRALADEVALYLARDARAASAGLLGTAARVLALSRALAARPTPDLVGRHRSHYERVGDVELVGMGARQWRTRSGYAGLTVYFWDRSARSWATWTDTRPLNVGVFDPVSRYAQDGPWSGCSSPREASRSTLRLLNTWRNRAGRLSARDATRALVTGPAAPLEVPSAISRWADLVERAVRLFGGGMQGRGELDDLVLLTPNAWGPAQFDSIRQELLRPVIDADGRTLPLVMPHTPETAGAVDALERHNPAVTRGLLGMLRLHAGQLAVEPIALYEEKKVFNITLDGTAGSKVAVSPAPAATDEEDEPAETEEEEVHTATALGLLLARMSERLEALGEAGLLAAPETESLRRFATQADGLGLAVCARPLGRLAEQLERARKSVQPEAGPAAETLLGAYYIVRFAAAQEAVAAATATLAE